MGSGVRQIRKERLGLIVVSSGLEILDQSVGVIVGRVEAVRVFCFVRRSEEDESDCQHTRLAYPSLK